MKVVILAGGFGTRMQEETRTKPKPMVQIDGKPILWHIMKIYSSYGYNDFIICCGYKGYVIKEYFINYYKNVNDMTVDLKNGEFKIHKNNSEDWKVTLVDTGLNTMTGGRIKRVKDYIGDETFLLTYGDGVADINIHKLVDFHKSNNRLVTVTAVQPMSRFGVLKIDCENRVESFIEKPTSDGTWINGGFFVCEPQILDYIKGDEIVWEKEPLESLANDGQLKAYKHYGFWKAMDNLDDKIELEIIFKYGKQY